MMETAAGDPLHIAEPSSHGGREHHTTVLRSSWWTPHVVIALAMPLLVFVVLRPERYGLTPNGTDPIFYSGYAINFDDVMRELGGDRYFVTRWPAYLPSRAFAWLFGPFAGRLVLRWLFASTILLAILHLGRRWRWRRSTELVACFSVLANPLFARAFMTEYVEWFVIAAGTLLVCQCLERRSTVARSITIGVLAAATVITNPITVALVGPPMLVYLVASWRRSARVVLHISLVIGAALATFAAGGLFYRYAYDIPNVYQPTIDFVRARAGLRDPHKSPRLEWMSAFLWIYAPAVLFAASAVIEPIRDLLRRDRAALAALGLLGCQYVFQWTDQFVRDGMGLEVAFYWSTIGPTYLVFIVVILGTVRWRPAGVFAFALVWILVLAAPRLIGMRLPAGWAFLAVLVLLVAVIAWTALRNPGLATAGAVILALATQTLAPEYDPSAYHRYNDSPRFDTVFFVGTGSDADLDYEAVVWLERTLDQLPSDDDLYFAPSADATNITGIYVPHVTSHLLWFGAFDDERSRATIDGGQVRRLAVYGDDDYVAAKLHDLNATTPPHTTILDRTDPRGHRHRLVVVEYTGADRSME